MPPAVTGDTIPAASPTSITRRAATGATTPPQGIMPARIEAGCLSPKSATGAIFSRNARIAPVGATRPRPMRRAMAHSFPRIQRLHPVAHHTRARKRHTMGCFIDVRRSGTAQTFSVVPVKVPQGEATESVVHGRPCGQARQERISSATVSRNCRRTNRSQDKGLAEARGREGMGAPLRGQTTPKVIACHAVAASRSRQPAALHQSLPPLPSP